MVTLSNPVGVGGTISYLAGVTPDLPEILQKAYH